jgi:kynurenine formamidase
MSKITLLTVLLCAVAGTSSSWGFDVTAYRLVDLTHSYNEDTIYWPTSPTSFSLDQLAFGETPGGWFYSANAINTPEHGGTHLDAPVHFSATGRAVHEIPLENLIAPAVLIDISSQASQDPNYRLSVDDVLMFEERYGRIISGSIVLLRTNWSERWPDTRAYLGDDTLGDASQLEFPSFGAESSRLLVEQRGVVLLGVDTASIDYGASQEFTVHRITAAANIAGLENLTRLAELPAVGFTVLALPMKIEGGSGAPVRVVALIPRD